MTHQEHNGRTILDLCELGDRILASYGIPPERAIVPGEARLQKTNAEKHETGRAASLVVSTPHVGSLAQTREMCDGCGGSGLVPANSGSDVADFKCQECNGKGVRP